MTRIDRRRFLAAAAAAGALPAAIARAQAIDPAVRSGTIADVGHVVILMQENRSFDHYFGAMPGVRGFADRFPIPLEGGRTVWMQPRRDAGHMAPFPLETTRSFDLMRVEGTPHNWTDAQAAWDHGRMSNWPAAKGEHAMAYYRAADIPFQYALADAFTVCDAYHCAMQVGTNTNRLFLFTGSNDPLGRGGGPSLDNSHDSLPQKGGSKDAYRWTTYPERLTAAGVSWRVYQDMADNFGDNPLEGFAAYRAALAGEPGSDPRLARDGLGTYSLERLRADVMADTLPQVVHVVAPAKDSEHPGPSSPAQGADYTARVLDALTANPKVWARTVLFLMFDENDGYFDHAPPPAPPSPDAAGRWLGGSRIDLAGEYHLIRGSTPPALDRPELLGRPYGLGPRVPMYVISPWSRGGWVNSEVSDHTSVIRFLETRFGVAEPNISPWRRAVCGDLTSAFDFKAKSAPAPLKMPATADTAARAAALKKTTRPPTPAQPQAPEQAHGVKRSRALPYQLEADGVIDASGARLLLSNTGAKAAVLHVYDRKDLKTPPRRYTLGPKEMVPARWPLSDGTCDLWILGPNGFHRHYRGGPGPRLIVDPNFDRQAGALTLTLRNPGKTPVEVAVAANAYGHKPWGATVRPGASAANLWTLTGSGGWYDLSVTLPGHRGWLRRLAGRLETGRDSVSDPAMHGPAIMTWET